MIIYFLLFFLLQRYDFFLRLFIHITTGSRLFFNRLLISLDEPLFYIKTGFISVKNDFSFGKSFSRRCTTGLCVRKTPFRRRERRSFFRILLLTVVRAYFSDEILLPTVVRTDIRKKRPFFAPASIVFSIEITLYKLTKILQTGVFCPVAFARRGPTGVEGACRSSVCRQAFILVKSYYS